MGRTGQPVSRLPEPESLRQHRLQQPGGDPGRAGTGRTDPALHHHVLPPGARPPCRGARRQVPRGGGMGGPFHQLGRRGNRFRAPACPLPHPHRRRPFTDQRLSRPHPGRPVRDRDQQFPPPGAPSRRHPVRPQPGPVPGHPWRRCRALPRRHRPGHPLRHERPDRRHVLRTDPGLRRHRSGAGRLPRGRLRTGARRRGPMHRGRGPVGLRPYRGGVLGIRA